MVNKIKDPKTNEDDLNEWLVLLEQNVPHPEVSDLIFWPQNYGLGLNPTSEEIVEKALSYGSIIL